MQSNHVYVVIHWDTDNNMEVWNEGFFRGFIPATIAIHGHAWGNYDDNMEELEETWITGNIVEYVLPESDTRYRIYKFPNGWMPE